MKIKIAKIIFLVICIGLFIFLLLPFLETTPPATPSQLKAQPQVTTDNPLTAIANRLRALLGGKERAKHRLADAQPLPSWRPTEEFLAAGAPARSTTSAAPVSSPEGPTRTIQVPPQEESFDFGDAALQTDQGEWVLIHQVAPENGQPGMHEVNVHDNPYDRYVKQERAKRALPEQPKQEIPDSAWARLVRPVKQFFGLDTPTPVGPSHISVVQEGPHTHSLASAKDTKSTEIKYPSAGPIRLPWPDISPKQWAQMTPQERKYEQDRRSVAQFTNLLSGEYAAREAAEIAADTKYPTPQNKQEEQAKEDYKQQMLEQNKQIIKNGILQVMQQNAQDKEPVDELSYAMGCKNNSLPTSICDPNHANTPQAQAEQIAQEQAKNSQLFFEKTGYELPKNLPLTIVLGPTTPEAIMQMTQTTDINTKQAAEIYQFLYETQKCASNTCYWVANSKQQDPQLKDTVSMTGDQFKPDPKNTYPGYKQAFVQYMVDKLPPEASDKQKKQVRQAAQKQFDENAVHFVPYTPQQLKEVQDQTLAAANPANKDGKAQDLTVFYMTDPAQASQFAKDIDSVIFGYGQISLTNATNAPDAAEQITLSTAQNVNDAKEVVSSLVTKPTAASALTQSINKQIRQQNQSGAGWEGVFKAIKGSNTPVNKGDSKK